MNEIKDLGGIRFVLGQGFLKDLAPLFFINLIKKWQCKHLRCSVNKTTIIVDKTLY